MARARQRTAHIRGHKPLWRMSASRRVRPKRKRGKVFKVVLAVFVTLIVVELLTLPFPAVWRLPFHNPSGTALMQQRLAEAREQGQPLKIDRRWIPLSQIPQHVRMAVLVAEDGAFYSHAGVDWYEVRQSMAANWEEGRIVRGGSTITQQLAKNLYLSTSRDPVRKFKELILTWFMEMRLSKSRILEVYLNSIEWGHGIFGIEAAAQRYFHKPASQLTTDEGARLAAVIPSPLRHRPTDHSDYVVKKKDLILKRMASRL